MTAVFKIGYSFNFIILDLSFDGNGENGNELKLFSFMAYGFYRQGLRQAMHFTLDEKVVFV